MTRAYSEAIVEVLDILEHTEEDKVNLIPKKFIDYLKEHSAKDYKVNLDYSKPINEMNIKNETKGILTTIYRNWWWNSNDKQEYDRLVREKEIIKQEELREKYNPDDVFKNRNITNNITVENKPDNSVAMIEVKDNIFSRFINSLRKLFKK